MGFWTNITDAQATIINGGLTILAAIVGVLLGSKLFSGKINTIEEAIRESKRLVEKHLSDIDDTLNGIKEKSAELDQVLAAVSQQVGKIAESRAELEQDDLPEDSFTETYLGQEGSSINKEEILKLWRQARDHLEALASNPEIDGRTRAKYLRIDRRSYDEFIDALARNFLPPDVAHAAHEAHSMRNSFRRRASPPSTEELAKMQELVAAVVAFPG